MKLNIRDTKKEEIAAVAKFIAESYDGDIFFKWVIGSDTDKFSDKALDIIAKYYEVYLSANGCVSHVAKDENDQLVGATVWLPHDVDAKIHDDINKVAGEYAANFQAVADASHENEPKGIAFYQLVAVVVDKTKRGQGIGEALLAEMLNILDSRGIDTYLEASTPYVGKGVYGKFGYKLYSELLKFTDTAVLYPLFRQAKNKSWLTEFVEKNPKPFSIIGDIGKTNPLKIDLGENGEYYGKIKDLSQKQLNDFLFRLLDQEKAKWAISGDREYRKLLYAHADSEWVDMDRTIHCGIDLIVPKDTAVFAPYDGEISHVLYEDCAGGYGNIIALKVSDFYLLFGHLSDKDLPKVGDKIKAGEQIGLVGDFEQNGDWFWHIHFQAMSQEGMDSGLIFEALFAKNEMELANKVSPTVMPIINGFSENFG